MYTYKLYTIPLCSTEAIEIKGKTMPINAVYSTALETTVLYEATAVLYDAHECYMMPTSAMWRPQVLYDTHSWGIVARRLGKYRSD